MSLFRQSEKKIEHAINRLTKIMSLKNYRRVALNFLILSVNLIVIILYFSLSSAKIVIEPKTEIVTDTIAIAAGGLEGRGVNALSVQILERQVSLSPTPFPITEQTELKKLAEGKITIYNTTADRAQTLVSETQLVSDAGEIIRLRQRVDLAPGQTIMAAAYSPDSEREIKSGRYQILKLPYLHDKIYAEVENNIVPQAEKTTTVTSEFYNQIFDSALALLRAQALQAWRTEGYDIEDDDYIEITLDELERDAEVGDRSKEKVMASAKGKARLAIFDKAQARQLAQAETLAALKESGQTLVEFLSGEDEFMPVFEDNELLVQVKARVADRINPDKIIKDELVGKNRDEVRNYLEILFPEAKVEVLFSPFWVRSVPNLKDHLEIEIR